ncbi:MAG: hypothetical protein ACI9IA_000731 [Enterobacterales bacterium]|jgi:hypothetical protein
MDQAGLTFDARDEFERKGIAEKIISLLKAGINISPMIIDGGWGVGKSEFCHKLIDLLKSNNENHLIYIDAFKADHANEPLMTVLAKVVKLIPDEKNKEAFIKKALPAVRYGLKTIAKAGVSHLLRQDVADVVDDFNKDIQKVADKTITAAVESALQDHIDADDNLTNLQTALKEISTNRPIIVFIDELDRCRPDFSVDMLETIKHVFDVDGVSFVLITNTLQLKASIKHCYGLDTENARRYLDKFVKFTLTLPERVFSERYETSIAAVDHYKNLVSNSHLLQDYDLCGQYLIITVEQLVLANNLSLREMESIVRHIEIYVILKNDYLKARGFGFLLLRIFAIVMYTIAPELAKTIVDKKLDSKLLGDFVGISNLPPLGEIRVVNTEVICFVLSKSAKFSTNLFSPAENELEAWERETKEYFNGAYFDNDNDYSEIFSNVIKTLQMC